MKLARRDVLVLVGVVLFGVALHAPSLRHGFVNWDDDRFITKNPLFAAGGWTYVRAALTRVQFEAYHPLHLLSYLPDRWLWPANPTGFHAGNVALFALDLLLLFFLARRHAGRGAAAIATLLLAAHPLCVEPVDWVSGRKDLLAAAFFIGVLLVEDGRADDEVRISPVGLSLFAAAILSKTSTLCLPLVLWCWLLWLKRVGARVASWRTLPYGVLALLPAAGVVAIWNKHGMTTSHPVAAPVDVLSTVATYARRVVWPSDLAPIYPVEMPAAALSALVVVVVVAALIICWRRLAPAARFAFVAFPLALLPVANVISVNYRIADRYALLALMVLVPSVAIGLDTLFRHGRLARISALCGASLVLVLLMRLTVTLTATWSDSRTLWAHATQAHPDAYMARIKYGETLIALRDWPDARTQFQAAIRQLPINYYGYAGLFYVYALRAEDEGRVPKGAGDRWRSEIDRAQVRSSTFDALIDSVPHAACSECFDTLLLLRLRRWRKPDDVLLRSARAAISEGAPDVALIFLEETVHKDSPEWRELFAQARPLSPTAAPRP